MLVGAGTRRPRAPYVAVSALTLTAVTALGAPAPAFAAFSCATSAPTYTVQAGDGWFGIADRAGVSRGDLLAANDADPSDTIVPGDRLCLPPGADAAVASGCASTYTVAGGDSWFAIAARAGTTGGALLAANDASVDEAIHPGDRICMPAGVSAPSGGANAANGSGSSSGSSSGSGTSGSYTVVRGDSWFGIASRSGVEIDALLDVNGADTGTLLTPGQSIALPSGAKSPTRASSGNGWVTLQALPVQGPCGYADTWHAPRSGGRVHEGVDLFAKKNQYVYAVVDGVLTDRAWDQPGRRAGNAWTLESSDGSGTWFFYAHMSGFANGLKEGSRVQAGQIIGFVGATGNAAAVHLHFEVHPNGGRAVNPYPIVKAFGGCNQGDPYTQPGGWVPERR